MTSDETCTTRRTRVPSSDEELLAVVSDGSPAALWRCSTTVTSTGSRSGWVVGAGTHHPPLVVRDTGTVEPVGKLGTAMGLVPAVDLDDVRVVLEPGDLVCPFTDGLVEVRGSGFHVRRRGGWRRPWPGSTTSPFEDVATELVEAPRRFHGRQLADDLAVLLLRAQL